MGDKRNTRARASSVNSVINETRSKNGKYTGSEQITRYLSNKDDNKSDTDFLNPTTNSNDRDTPPENLVKVMGKRIIKVIIKVKKMSHPKLSPNPVKRIIKMLPHLSLKLTLN